MGKNSGRNSARKEANIEAKRQQEFNWRSLSPQEQLKQLDYRNGKGKGATRQRRKIQAYLDSAPAEAVKRRKA